MTETSTGVQLARGSSVLVIFSIGAVLPGVVYYIILARLVDPTDMGFITILMLIYSVATIVGDLGLHYASPKYMPEYIGTNRGPRAKSVFNIILRITLVSGLTISAVTLIFSEWLSVEFTGSIENTIFFQLTALSIFGATLFPVSLSFLAGLKRMTALAILDFSNQVVRKYAGLVLLAAGLGLLGIVYGWIMIDIGTVLIGILLAYRGLPKVAEKVDLKPILLFSIPMFGTGLLNFLLTWVDRAIVLALQPLAVLGVYQIASVGWSVLVTVPQSIFTVLVPNLSEVNGKFGRETVSELIPNLSRYIGLLITPLIFMGVLYSGPLLRFTVGEAYIAAAAPFAVMAVGAMAFGFSIILGTILIVTENTRQYFIAYFTSFIIYFGANVALIPLGGVIGIAAGKTILQISIFAMSFLYVRRIMRVSFDVKAIAKSILSAIGASGVSIILGGFFSGVAHLIVGLVSFGLTYVFLSILMRSVTQSDVDFFESVIPKRLGWLLRPLKYALRYLGGESETK